MLGHIADVIIHAKFDDNRFRGLRVLIPPILPFSIGIAGRPYNSEVPCYTVMYFFTGLKPEILLHFRFCGTTWRMKIYVWHGSKQHNQPCDSSRTRSSSISPSGIAVRNTHTHTHTHTWDRSCRHHTPNYAVGTTMSVVVTMWHASHSKNVRLCAPRVTEVSDESNPRHILEVKNSKAVLPRPL